MSVAGNGVVYLRHKRMYQWTRHHAHSKDTLDNSASRMPHQCKRRRDTIRLKLGSASSKAGMKRARLDLNSLILQELWPTITGCNNGEISTDSYQREVRSPAAIQNLMKSDTPVKLESGPHDKTHLTHLRPPPAWPVLHGLHVLKPGSSNPAISPNYPQRSRRGRSLPHIHCTANPGQRAPTSRSSNGNASTASMTHTTGPPSRTQCRTSHTCIPVSPETPTCQHRQWPGTLIDDN